MSLEAIKKIYNVPAERGQGVIIAKSDGTLQKGVIVGSGRGQFLKVKLEDETIRLCHPARCKYI
jgi:hypothetical protein